MSKNVPAVRLVDRDEAPELPELSDELRLAFTELAGAAREGLLAMSVSVGLRVMAEMMEEEVTTKVGPKHAKLPGRSATRHASAVGSVALGGRRVSVQRPRARTTDNTEVHLDTYGAFADDDVLSAVVMERMLAGLATRRHRAANEPVGAAVEAEARSTSKSSVSRRFVAKTKKALDELMARDLGDIEVVALMVDGVHFAEHCCVVALAICADGTKVPVGLWLGDTTRRSSPTSWPISSIGDCRPRVDCWSSSTGPRLWLRACARSSATPPSSRDARSISAGTVPTICLRPSEDGSMPAWPRPSTMPILPPGYAWLATSPARSRPGGPTPPPACAKGWRTCSPFVASASAIASPAPSPAPIPSSP